jgi:hypothetical protein
MFYTGNGDMSFTSNILFLAVAAQLGWVEIEYKDADARFYVNTASMRVAGDKVYYWQKTVYAQPRTVDGKSASSEFNNAVIDCVAATQAFLYLSWYENALASGPLTKYLFFPEKTVEYRPIVADSRADIERKLVCGAK